eukprot:COSAG02_NODE_16686_length_1063_cov_67.251037_1_plen_211_part_10
MKCVAICTTQQAHRCSGELQVPSVRPSVVHAVCAAGAGAGRRTAVARVREEEEAGRLESRRTGARRRREAAPTHAGRIRSPAAGGILTEFACLSISSAHQRFPIFFAQLKIFSQKKKQWRRRTELGKPRCRDPQQHQCRDHKNTNAYTRKPQCRDPQKHQCLHSKTPMPRPTKTPMPTLENPDAATHKKHQCLRPKTPMPRPQKHQCLHSK